MHCRLEYMHICMCVHVHRYVVGEGEWDSADERYCTQLILACNEASLPIIVLLNKVCACLCMYVYMHVSLNIYSISLKAPLCSSSLGFDWSG